MIRTKLSLKSVNGVAKIVAKSIFVAEWSSVRLLKVSAYLSNNFVLLLISKYCS
jgi:hypothetical protein